MTEIPWFMWPVIALAVLVGWGVVIAMFERF